MSKLCPKCQYFVGAPLLSSTALILLSMEFTRAAQFVAGILFHSSIMTSRMLDVRHMVLLHLQLEDAPHVLNRVQVWRHTWPLHHLHLQLHQQGSCHLSGVFGVVAMLDNCHSAQFQKGGHHILLQNVSVHVGIHVSLNEPQLPSTRSTHAAPPPCLTVGKAQFSWYSSPGRHHTCWTPSEPNKFTLDSSDHRAWFQ